MGSAPSAPAVPDPTTTASSQGAADVGTALANSTLDNPNVTSALGSVSYAPSGQYQTVTEPDGSTQQVPRYTETQTLSPQEQTLFDQQAALGSQENTIAAGALTNVGTALQQPVANAAPLQSSAGPVDQAAVQQAIDAQYSLMQPMQNQQHQQLQAQLAAQGISPTGAGNTAYANAQQIQGVNDAADYSAAVGAGDQEQSTLYNEQLQNAALNNSASGQGLSESIAEQNQPINEVTALASGGQASIPQFQAYQGGTVAQNPISQDTYASANLANQQYQAQTAANSAEMGGLFGLGGTAAKALIMSDPALKDDHGTIGMVGKIPVHQFNYKGDPTPLRGFMADEVKKVAPSAVKTTKSGYKAVDYAKALMAA